MTGETERARAQPRIVEALLRIKATSVLHSPHFWTIAALMSALGYVYYNVIPGFHDVYVILFFYPLIYAALAYRLRGVVVSSIAFLLVLLPNALFYSIDPHSTARALLFAAFAFVVSGLCAALLDYVERQIEAYKEILSLNVELNSYIGQLERMQKQLIQSEKLNALGQLSAAIAHEINNPLAGALVYARLLSKKLAEESIDKRDVLDNLAKIDAAVSRCSTLVKGLLDFARQREPAFRAVPVSDIIDQALSLVGHQAQMKNIEIVREEAPDLPQLRADPDQLVQVLINLVVNAIQAINDGGRIVVRTAADADRVRISIQDTGIGISAENLDKLFTPFFTTKEKGVGLGLAVSYGIIERHGGKIEVESAVGEGTTFTLVLSIYSP